MNAGHNALFRFVAAALALSTAAQLPAANNDPGAGSWQMVVLTGPAQIPVAAPAPITDPGYQAELEAIKSAQANVTSAQQKSIDYWNSGAVMRWNEILIELIARADLPPEPNSDGSYSFPDPKNPFAFPQYPFSNPPYASRALSYVSLAQYEALKVAWHYKYLYNRPSPAKVDTSIRSLAPIGDLPSYPSEDAVIAGVNVALLTLLFPTNVDEINSKAADQQAAAQLSGKASASDIAAGLALGKAVAKIFAARAGSDGMKSATGTPAQWQALADAATARGQIPWKSQEVPPRPPMLPFFGKVKGWMMTPADIVRERPVQPPSTSSDAMAQQITAVRQAVRNITDEQLATVYKWNDGASSPTPPGHWNLIAETYINNAGFSEVRAARAYALLNMALHDAAVSCWDAKYLYFLPRAVQLDPTIKTWIALPNFPSYTSGHSVYSAAAAEVLSYLFPSVAGYLNSQKDEAALSRLYSGIHYPIDIEAGKDQGKRVGDYTVRFAQQDGADQASAQTAAGIALDAASFRRGLTAGSIAAVFHPHLSTATQSATTVPLPTSLGNASMQFNNLIPTPLFGVASGQANIQIPWELQGLSSATLTVTDAAGARTSFSVPLSQYAPSIFSVNQQGFGQGQVVIANTSTLAAPNHTGGQARAAAKSEFITIYCQGLGAVSNPPPTGAAAAGGTSTTKSPVAVELNGVSLPAAFAGLVPGGVGLYQVNVQVPNDAPSGDAIPLALTVGGVKSNTVTIAIQ